MYLAKILIPAGGEQEVGSPVAIAVEEEEDIEAFKDFTLKDLIEEVQEEIHEQEELQHHQQQ